MENVFVGIAPRLFTEHQSPQKVPSWTLREKHQGKVGVLEQQVTADARLKTLRQLGEHNHIRRELAGADEQIERVFAHSNNPEFLVFLDNCGQHFRPFRPNPPQKNLYHRRITLLASPPSISPRALLWLIRGCDSVACRRE